MTREDVKEALHRRGTKHNFVAEKLGVTKKKFSQWINGKCRLTDKEEENLYKYIESIESK